MALTRTFLKALDIDADKIQQIIDAHAETVDALKEERDGYKAKAEEAASKQKELDSLKETAKKDKADYDAKVKELNGQIEKLQKDGSDATKVQADFDAFKKQIADEKVNGEKNTALEAIIKGIGITSETARKLILKGYDLNTITLKDGKIENQVDIEKALKTDYAELISSTKPEGTPPVTPPTGGGTAMTKEKIIAIRDSAQRREEIAKHPELFGLTKE